MALGEISFLTHAVSSDDVDMTEAETHERHVFVITRTSGTLAIQASLDGVTYASIDGLGAIVASGTHYVQAAHNFLRLEGTTGSATF